MYQCGRRVSVGIARSKVKALSLTIDTKLYLQYVAS